MRIALVIPVGLFLACHNPELTLKDLKVTLDALSAEEQQTIRRAQLRVHSSRPGPERAEAIGELGMVLHAHGFIDAAARCGDKAAVAAPGEFRWHYYAARAHIESFNYVAALAALDRALALDAGYEPAWTAKGRVLLLLGHLEEAKGAYTSAGALNPNSAVALSGLA
ncbi:MAG: tetratricopeptide repeat protein, partial [Myxococcota bacterium]